MTDLRCVIKKSILKRFKKAFIIICGWDIYLNAMAGSTEDQPFSRSECETICKYLDKLNDSNGMYTQKKKQDANALRNSGEKESPPDSKKKPSLELYQYLETLSANMYVDKGENLFRAKNLTQLIHSMFILGEETGDVTKDQEPLEVCINEGERYNSILRRVVRGDFNKKKKHENDRKKREVIALFLYLCEGDDLKAKVEKMYKAFSRFNDSLYGKRFFESIRSMLNLGALDSSRESDNEEAENIFSSNRLRSEDGKQLFPTLEKWSLIFEQKGEIESESGVEFREKPSNTSDNEEAGLPIAQHQQRFRPLFVWSPRIIHERSHFRYKMIDFSYGRLAYDSQAKECNLEIPQLVFTSVLGYLMVEIVVTCQQGRITEANRSVDLALTALAHVWILDSDYRNEELMAIKEDFQESQISFPSSKETSLKISLVSEQNLDNTNKNKNKNENDNLFLSNLAGAELPENIKSALKEKTLLVLNLKIGEMESDSCDKSREFKKTLCNCLNLASSDFLKQRKMLSLVLCMENIEEVPVSECNSNMFSSQYSKESNLVDRITVDDLLIRSSNNKKGFIASSETEGKQLEAIKFFNERFCQRPAIFQVGEVTNEGGEVFLDGQEAIQDVEMPTDKAMTHEEKEESVATNEGREEFLDGQETIQGVEKPTDEAILLEEK